MQGSRRQLRRGFTLLEIMVVVAIIAMLAAIATSNIMRARKRAQAVKVLDDLRNLDNALDTYALENNKSGGDGAVFSDLQPYLKQLNKLALSGVDVFNQPYGPFTVDTPPKVPNFTYGTLSDVVPPEFWSPYGD